DLRGQRQLNEDAVHVVAGVEFANNGEQFGGGGVRGRRDVEISEAELLAGGDFAANVDFGSGVFADEDGGESGTNADGTQFGDLLHKFAVDLVANCVSAEQTRGHEFPRKMLQ